MKSAKNFLIVAGSFAPDGRFTFSANHTSYADAGTAVQFFASRSSSANVGDVAFAALYGHLEDAP